MTQTQQLRQHARCNGNLMVSQLPGATNGILFHSFDYGDVNLGSVDEFGYLGFGGHAAARLVLLDSTYGNVLDTDGAYDRLEIPHSEQAALGQNDADFSVGFWLQLQSIAVAPRVMIANKGDDISDRTFGIWAQPDNRLLYQISTVNSPSEGRNSNAQLTIGAWTHVTYVKAGSELKLYLDGVLDSTRTLSGPVVSNEGPIRLGGYSPRGMFAAADALYDDFYIVAAALTDAEIQQLATIHAAEGSVQTIEILP